MKSAGEIAEEAHSLSARATGRLSLAIAKRRLKRDVLEAVVRELREALTLVEKDILNRHPSTPKR